MSFTSPLLFFFQFPENMVSDIVTSFFFFKYSITTTKATHLGVSLAARGPPKMKTNADGVADIIAPHTHTVPTESSKH